MRSARTGLLLCTFWMLGIESGCDAQGLERSGAPNAIANGSGEGLARTTLG